MQLCHLSSLTLGTPQVGSQNPNGTYQGVFWPGASGRQAQLSPPATNLLLPDGGDCRAMPRCAEPRQAESRIAAQQPVMPSETGRAAEAELMSIPPVTISPDSDVADAARLMYERGVKRLPVVDDAGQLAGIVSRIDVLSVFTRPDGQLRDAVMERVIAGRFALNPDAFDMSVTSGIVTITDQVARGALASQLVDAVRHLEGVVDVRDRVSYPA
jgi:hypothetical protein